MNKIFFRFLVVLMSLSLIGIILVQVYWFNTSFKNNEEQFGFHVEQVLGHVSDKLQKEEAYSFIDKYKKLKDSIGKEPQKSDFLEFGYYQRDSRTKETIIYSNNIISEDFSPYSTLFDKRKDSVKLKNFSAKRVTEVFRSSIDKTNLHQQAEADLKLEKSGKLDILDNAQFEIFFKDIASLKPLQDRVSNEKLQQLLTKELADYGVTTPVEFAVYSNGLATKIHSDRFVFKPKDTYKIPVFVDNENTNQYTLMISFPNKVKFLFSELVGITLLSVIFTLIIIIAYSSALNQLIRQRQISEIKTDFINNMTHEFKTPIATINLALDAIKNPKVIHDSAKVERYLQMIRDENKRMHAQVENVLRISRLEKRELEIKKDNNDIHELIQDAIEHVQLILEDRGGTIVTVLAASRTTTLVNDVHFTNVLVNIIDNAIKYSAAQPEISIGTENVNDFVLVKIADKGLGMSKIAQKRIFEKFYREHTGDIHNVKGHGLGLAYVKSIVDDHNAEIFVESEKGKGSTFIIKIPLIN